MVKSTKKNRGSILIKDAIIVAVSIVVAIIIVKTGVIHTITNLIDGNYIIPSFIAGMFFTSMFTIAPAAVALAELGQTTPISALVLIGALGAVVGDLIIFLFIRDGVSEDIKTLIKGKRFKKFAKLSHFGFLRWLVPVLGALVIASPLPDELGLAMMGMSKVKTPIFIPIAFIMNALGIYAIVTFGQGI
jgi:hypothetical protein